MRNSPGKKLRKLPFGPATLPNFTKNRRNQAFFYATPVDCKPQHGESTHLAAKIQGCFKPYPDLSLL